MTDIARIKDDGTGVVFPVKPSRQITGPATPPNNRRLPSVDATHGAAADTTNHVLYTAAENITEVEIYNAGAQVCRVVFDAASRANADADLGISASGPSQQLPFEQIKAGETRTFTGASYFTSLDFEREAAETAEIFVSGR